jgi:hypothetical protein
VNRACIGRFLFAQSKTSHSQRVISRRQIRFKCDEDVEGRPSKRRHGNLPGGNPGGTTTLRQKMTLPGDERGVCYAVQVDFRRVGFRRNSIGFARSLGRRCTPSGTILAVSLDSGLNAAKIHAGQQICATVMQDVPGTQIRRRARVAGHVVKAGASKNGQTELEIQFDAVEINGRMVPIKTNLRALASFVAVEDAQDPEDMSSRGLNPSNWTTQQVGGEQFYRGSFVARGMTKVGQTTPFGALDEPQTQSGMRCRGAIGKNHGPQAMWLFSSDACGLYGLSNIRIEHAGRSDPLGTILLVSTNGKLNLGSGTGLLLRASSPAFLTAAKAGAESSQK